jgi:hypothetical protein
MVEVIFRQFYSYFYLYTPIHTQYLLKAQFNPIPLKRRKTRGLYQISQGPYLVLPGGMIRSVATMKMTIPMGRGNFPLLV